MNNKLRPAITGGIVLGLLSAIPFINAANACCCAWGIAGGALAAYLYVKQSTAPVGPGEGAVLGAIAGGIGALIYIVLGLPLSLLVGNAFSTLILRFAENMNPEQAEIFRAQIEAMQNLPLGARLVAALPFTFIGALLLAAFATLGGLLGAVIFEKRKGGATAAPQNFGAPPPGTYGSGGSSGV
jgi:hypothetical protein